MINRDFKSSCNFESQVNCGYQSYGIKNIYMVPDESYYKYLIEDNLIVDMVNFSWLEIKPSNLKLSQIRSVQGLETIQLTIEISSLEYQNDINIKKILKGEYNFLILTNNNNLYYLDTLSLVSMVETFNPNGYNLVFSNSKDKVLWQVDYNYYEFNFLVMPDTPVIIPCSFYYSDLALSSTQPNSLLVSCIVSDYDGWV
jgi:hypothetical protein